jgi:hypothetical protein
MNYKTIDSHIHCGIQNINQPIEVILPLLKQAEINYACMFAPVEDIYDRYDYNFIDNQKWQKCRSKANLYLKELSKSHQIIPYFFVWNDFKKDELTEEFKGIKWHRHSDEPIYNYNDNLCEEFLQKVYKLNIPIVLEEEFNNTLYLINRINGKTIIIIPHLGGLNGGYYKLKQSKIWEFENVYTDTALASSDEILDFINTYGVKKILFGSDFPFGNPYYEKQKIIKLNLTNDQKERILFKNISEII